jgi:hypothetical protein
MGNKDFIKPILERKGTVHFGKVRDSFPVAPLELTLSSAVQQGCQVHRLFG